MAKVLLVDTNFSSAPIHRELLSLGHDVHVVGGNPQDCLAKQTKNYWQINYADIHALQELVDRENFDFVVPGCTDRSYESCAQLSGRQWPGIDHPDVNQIINNKSLFKKWAVQAGLPVAQAQDPFSAAARWPMIVKPVDAFSGKGISILKSKDEKALNAALVKARQASPSHEFLVEDYVEGQLYSHSAFLRGHKVAQDFVVREDRTVNPFVVDTSCVIHQFPIKILKKIREFIELISRELKLTDGLIHTQFILDADQFWFIELTRRCPGDLYSLLIELSTGFPYSRVYALPFTDDYTLPNHNKINYQYIMRHTITLDKNSALGYLHFKQDVRIERWISLSLVGDLIRPSPSSRIGIIFCKAKDEPDLAKLYKLTLSRQLYHVGELS